MTITLDKEAEMNRLRSGELDISDVSKLLIERGISQKIVSEALVAALYNAEIIDSPQACEILGVSRRDFEGEILGKYGFVAYGNSDEDLALEFNRRL